MNLFLSSELLKHQIDINQLFSGVFRVFKTRTLARNRLIRKTNQIQRKNKLNIVKHSHNETEETCT